MKKFLIIPLFLVLFFLFLVIWWRNVSFPVNTRDSTPRDFLITKGQSTSSIAKKLEKEGLVKSEFAFRFYVQLTGRDKKIPAGEYRLSANSSLQQLVEILSKGPQELWVTVPEGLRREEIAVRTIKALGLEGERAQAFWEGFIEASSGKEGFLFPDTYLFARDIKPELVVSKLRSTFDSRVNGEMLSDLAKSGKTINEVIILASLIEREARGDEERPVVTGILLNRIKIGMALQADASLQYVTGSERCRKDWLSCDWWKPPTAEDKTKRSAYNTYTNTGLPAGPISNPGISSIKAAIYPQDTSYLYYLHDNDGKVHYAKTLEEHNSNVSRYLR
ncbi:MAG: endolytic transglycosylase MltG [Candidatus Blackburnbacteria bacterium]|nr:endolytic transglycosylase MltG [Candidatus Blackburnbacteria bacterium]